MTPSEDKAVGSGRNFYYEGQHGAEEPADSADRLRLVRERDALRARCEADDKLLRQALDALEYHRDQTRPIVLTDAAIAGLRAHLKGAGRE